MKHTLRLLNLEDNQNDSELVHVRLAEEGVECDLVRVETREEFVAAVTQGGFDLILADYSLPSFDGLSALKIAKGKCPEVPFIFVSGAIGEEFAIETLKRGATDYVLKDRLSRLATAIRRALKEAEERIRRKEAEEALRRSYEELERKVEDRTAELRRTNETLRDEIIERKRLEEKLHTASITDELTGILNRRGFLMFAEKQFEIAKRNKRAFSILYLDLNGLKKINDEFGHKEGDEALVDISNVLKRTFRTSDIIARIGGDEFTVLITEPLSSTIEKTTAEHIRDNLRLHNEKTKKGYELSVSMGVVHYDPEEQCSVEKLLARADELMYEHKQSYQLEKETIPSSKGGKRGERVYIRYETDNNNSVELVVSGNAMIKNISIGGISMRTSQRLTKNTVYTVKMLGNRNEELLLKGLVVWSSLLGKVSEKDGTGPYYEAGLRFIELNDSLISSLEKLIIDLAD
jgi:diguanylate cyclase (GGDEF)-like protein